MKVLINTCYGGFGLSEEALDLYYTKKGIKFYKFKEKSLTTYYTVSKEVFDAKYAKGWHNMTDTEKKEINSFYLSTLDIERNDPTLIEVFEELGEKCNCTYSNLSIVDIPDDVDWFIEEYDGSEWVSESHRTWR